MDELAFAADILQVAGALTALAIWLRRRVHARRRPAKACVLRRRPCGLVRISAYATLTEPQYGPADGEAIPAGKVRLGKSQHATTGVSRSPSACQNGSATFAGYASSVFRSVPRQP